MDMISIPRGVAQAYLDGNPVRDSGGLVIRMLREAIWRALEASDEAHLAEIAGRVCVVPSTQSVTVSGSAEPPHPNVSTAPLAAFIDHEGKVVVFMRGAEQKNLVEFSFHARGIEAKVDAKFHHVAGSKG